ncbi:MAG: hypothetical protein RH862_03510 [Leptospiraceae bacterium]
MAEFAKKTGVLLLARRPGMLGRRAFPGAPSIRIARAKYGRIGRSEPIERPWKLAGGRTEQ